MADAQTATHLGLELHRLVASLEPARWRDDMRDELVAGFQSLLIQLEDSATSLEEGSFADAHDEFDAVLQTLRASVPTSSDLRDRWMEFRREIHPRYEALASALRAHHVTLPSLRPTNYHRSLMHVASGFVGLFFVEFTPWNIVTFVAVGFAVLAWSLEISRQHFPKWNDILMWVLGPVAHPHERFKVNSATWYATALAILCMTGNAAACAAGVMALGLGDPAAAFIGRKWGRHKLVHNRSLEGTVAFFVVAAIAITAVFSVFHADMSWTTRIGGALVAALVGALAELFSGSVDDNFSIPLFAGLATYATLLLLS